MGGSVDMAPDSDLHMAVYTQHQPMEFMATFMREVDDNGNSLSDLLFPEYRSLVKEAAEGTSVCGDSVPLSHESTGEGMKNSSATLQPTPTSVSASRLNLSSMSSWLLSMSVS